MVTVTKAKIAEEINKKVGISFRDAQELVDEILELMKSSLEKGENVKISGFGTFILRDKGKRIGRNPKTKVEIEIPPRRVVIFHPSQVWRKEINKK